MSKLTLGVLAGIAIAAAVPALAVTGSADIVLNAGAATTPPASSTAARTSASGTVAAKTVTSTSTKPLVRTVRAVRSVRLVIPTATNKVGTNVTGYIQVVDTAGSVVTPVTGVEVGLQQLRGKTYVEIADGTTDTGGTYPIAFTSATNMSLRAVLKPTNGKPVYSAAVPTLAASHVTWAARPTMETTAKTSVSYSFRVDPESGSAVLQIANSRTPTKWTSTKAVAVPTTGVVNASVTFPSAGTWVLRGASVASKTNAAGYTSTLTVTVH
ncbi:MAG TPA: hypothetical protein VI248_13830 [Kineosporiaceae bacterium]